MIPRIIHRIWLDEVMPSEFEQYGKEWRRLHPDWTIWDWRDSRQVLGFARFPELITDARMIFPRDWKRFQADILRLDLLYTFGGVYADTDVEPLKAFDPLLEGNRAWVAYSPNTFRGVPLVTQAIMAAEPCHPWVDECLNSLHASIGANKGKPLSQVVGPHLVNHALKFHKNEVTVFNSKRFYPLSIEDRNHGKQPDLRGCYAWHKWATTRAKTDGTYKRPQ